MIQASGLSLDTGDILTVKRQPVTLWVIFLQK